MRRLLTCFRIAAYVSAFSATVALIAFEILVRTAPTPPFTAAAREVSPVVLSADGVILTAYLSQDGKWRLKTTTADLPPFYLPMLLAYEDKRFYEHHGVDLVAGLRAAYSLVRERRIVSGASTISMQSARLLGAASGGVWGKVRQAAAAVKMERVMTKDEILGLYLTLAPFGGNIEGLRMAALYYFGKEPRSLSVGEAALLIGLPQSPESRRPDLHADNARRAQAAVLQRAIRANILSERVAKSAAEEVSNGKPASRPSAARHLSDRLMRRAATPSIRTTIDSRLQAKVERIAKEYVRAQPDPVNMAILVVANSDASVRAYLGGADYYDSRRSGMVDLVRAVRSPGSTLKPLIYGIAFEDLLVHPATIVTDQSVSFESYSPQNFDNLYRGDLTVADALRASVNTVAVMLLGSIGPDRFLSRLDSADLGIVLPSASTSAGLAVALGGVGMNLENLARLYAGFAHAGIVRPLRYSLEDPPHQGVRILSPDAAWALADVLADMVLPDVGLTLRSRDGGRRVAFKTGTSYGYRDAWAVGFDADHTVAVWIGRPDGVGRPGETGARAAAPIMLNVFDTLPAPPRDVADPRPLTSTLARQLDLPKRLRRYPSDPAANAQETKPLQPLSIRFPADGATVLLNRAQGGFTPLVITADGGRPPFRWYVDGKIVARATQDSSFRWKPDSPGQVDISVVDSERQRASTSVWLQ